MTERALDNLYTIPDVVYITVTNFGDKLPQDRWANMLTEIVFLTREAGRDLGEWYSSPLESLQSACFGVLAVKPAKLPWLRDSLKEIATRYELDGIGWSETAMELLRQAGVP